MSAIASKSLNSRSLPLRPIVLGGLFISINQAITLWIVAVLIQKNTYLLTWQYIASGVLGLAAFEGGIATGLVGLFFHLIISFTIATVFILVANRIPFLRRYAVPASVLYGFGVFLIMNMIVVPLSATPPLPDPTLPWVIEAILEHLFLVGLPLGILVKRSADSEN